MWFFCSRVRLTEITQHQQHGVFTMALTPQLGFVNGQVIPNAEHKFISVDQTYHFPRKLGPSPFLYLGQQIWGMVRGSGAKKAVSASQNEEPGRTCTSWTVEMHVVFYEEAAACQTAINRALSRNSSSMTTNTAKWKPFHGVALRP
jgi:hypothetical protein